MISLRSQALGAGRSLRRSLLVLLLWSSLAGPSAAAEPELRVAVAANFLAVLQQLAPLFQQQAGVRVVPVSSSTGKLYAQIRNGAPYDLFLAADRERPERLESEGLTRAGSRHTYALGRLVLWSPDPDLVRGPDVLGRGGFHHLAIANPRTAPYGAAAAETLRALGFWARVQDRLVQGESVNQAFQFVAGGAAELGLVAASQIGGREGSAWPVPSALHAPIEQQLVVLSRAADKPEAERFLAFLLRDPRADALIRAAGYLRAGASADAVPR